ncbi:LysR family transcriptional regulator [Thalassospira australica]|uniref:LysR family transcriptional regulator n=1 Tax=Thalassospira australica TaxID=1528106 RepID=UPI00051A88E5|nr:LysR family transcriptional regulator [Thalassospira australica]
MNIAPAWLKTFCTVCDSGSFTRAADALGLTQAAVSQHIAHIEHVVGPVFLRRGRKIEIMPSGRALLQYARDVDAASHRLAHAISPDRSHAGTIRIATPGSSGLRIYDALLSLQVRHPDISVHHRFAPTDDIIDAVIGNRVELGIITHMPDDARLRVRKIGIEPLELIVPATVEIKSYKDLCDLGFIDHPDGASMATRLLGQVFREFSGVKQIPCRGFSNQITLILEPVARGLGFTILPRFARKAFRAQDQIAVHDHAPRVFDTLYAISRAEWPLSALSETVLDEIHRVIADQDKTSVNSAL